MDLSEKIMGLIYSLEMLIVSLGIIYLYFKRRVNKVILILGILIFWVYILFIGWIFFPQSIIYPIFGILSLVLLPLCFYGMGIGVMIYGLLFGIVKRKIFISGFPSALSGPLAIYFGIFFFICGAMVIMGTTYVVSLGFCKGNNIFCSIKTLSDSSFGLVGNALMFIAKPLIWLMPWKFKDIPH